MLNLYIITSSELTLTHFLFLFDNHNNSFITAFNDILKCILYFPSLKQICIICINNVYLLILFLILLYYCYFHY